METTSRMGRIKDARKESILKAAEALFLAKGYQNTSMNDLADEADLTKKTLYSYFSCKEDLYYAVVARWYEALLAEIRVAARDSGTVIDRMIRGSRAYIELYGRNPVIFSLMNNLESVRLTGNVETLEGMKRLAAIKKDLFARMFELFDEGKKDGSIRDDIDTPTLVASFVFNLTGFFYILSSNGMNFTRFFNLDLTRFIETSVTLIIDSLRPDRGMDGRSSAEDGRGNDRADL